MVTILLPTVNRAQMLRTALDSLAAQTALARISRVIVSENSGGRPSEAVCHDYAGRLPIEYRAQSRPLSPLEHLITLKAPLDGFVAMLHDDDWWAPEHLAASLDRLQRHPDAAVTYSGLYYVEAESSLLECDSNVMFWFGANFPAMAPAWRLTTAEVLLSSLWGTAGHFSAFLARADAYRHAARVYELGNPWDVDRMLTMEFARCGPLVFGPAPEVFIRRHAHQGTHVFSLTERYSRLRTTTERLIRHANEITFNLHEGIAQRLAVAPPSSRLTVLNALAQSWCVEPLAAHKLAPHEIIAHAAALTPKPKNAYYYLGQLFPPLLLGAWKRLRHSTS